MRYFRQTITNRRIGRQDGSRVVHWKYRRLGVGGIVSPLSMEIAMAAASAAVMASRWPTGTDTCRRQRRRMAHMSASRRQARM